MRGILFAGLISAFAGAVACGAVIQKTLDDNVNIDLLGEQVESLKKAGASVAEVTNAMRPCADQIVQSLADTGKYPQTCDLGNPNPYP